MTILPKKAIRADFLELVGKRLEKAPVEIRDTYQITYDALINNEVLTVIRSQSSHEGRTRLAGWLLAVEVMDLTEFPQLHQSFP